MAGMELGLMLELLKPISEHHFRLSVLRILRTKKNTILTMKISKKKTIQLFIKSKLS